MDNLSKYLQERMNASSQGAEYRRMQAAVQNDADVQAFIKAHSAELADSAVERGTAKLYEYVQQRDKIARGEQPFAPGYEPVLVVSAHLIDIEYRPTAAKIAADGVVERQSLVTAINMPKDIRHADLATYEQTDERIDAIVAATDFTVAIKEHPHAFTKGLYLSGPFGVGKTYLLGAVAKKIAEFGVATTLLHVPTFAVTMKAAIGDNSVLPRIEQVEKAQVLVLDDIGAEALSPWFRDEVLGVILQYRMQEQLPTLFSSNKSMTELEGFFAGNERGDAENVKAARIMERVRYLAREVFVGGINRRQTE
ncbi:primosomal protein DnaI [Lacticaseibacillus zhaodongensis]|uniref:primosomal protein DnaI n=1 Tax=Lacticaseibacillus zhaodongensis TaxID=2668065 RepID=UPI0012D2D7F4|nr:primosomal protein DnaI [Lacticaseibacillus zhaodongensis]